MEKGKVKLRKGNCTNDGGPENGWNTSHPALVDIIARAYRRTCAVQALRLC